MLAHRSIDRLDDWVAETPESIAARLEGAKASLAQLRWTLGLMALISMMMLIAAYNAYSSYDYGWTLGVVERQITEENASKERINAAAQEGPERKAAAEREEAASQLAAQKTVAGVLTEQALKDWAASRIVHISLLGIRVSVDDAAVLGSAVLVVLSFWLVLVTRRENHTIGFLLRDTDTPRFNDDRDLAVATFRKGRSKAYSSGQRWLIFHTIVSNSLFATMDHSLSTVRSLRGPNPLGTATSWLKRRVNKAAFGLVQTFFFLFPVIASLIVFIVDRLSYFLDDPFLPNGAAEGTERPFYWISLAVFVVCWILLLICCLQSRRYSTATGNLLQDYGGKLRGDLLQSSGSVEGKVFAKNAAVDTPYQNRER